MKVATTNQERQPAMRMSALIAAALAFLTMGPAMAQERIRISSEWGNISAELADNDASMDQAIQCARPGAMIGYVGVPHGVQLEGQSLFFSQTGMMGGPAPVRRFL